jgi:hypothetical protein
MNEVKCVEGRRTQKPEIERSGRAEEKDTPEKEVIGC